VGGDARWDCERSTHMARGPMTPAQPPDPGAKRGFDHAEATSHLGAADTTGAVQLVRVSHPAAGCCGL